MFSLVSLFQCLDIREKIVNILLREFAQQFAVLRQSIVYLDLDAVAAERPVPSLFVPYGNHKIVRVLHSAFHLFARSQGYHRGAVLPSRIKHPRLQLDWSVLT